MRYFLAVLAVLAVGLAAPESAFAQMASVNFKIPFDDMVSGGGDTSSSANFAVHDTQGQGVIGPGASANFNAGQGYRYGDSSGVLNLAFVDAGGTPIAAPVADFTSATVGATSITGTLGTAASKIRITNTRSIAPWSVTIAATGGPTATWQSGANIVAFNNPGASTALSIAPGSGTITPGGACTATDLTLGPAATFNQGVVDSITLLTAGGAADINCLWDLTGVGLSQTIPSNQASGAYSIGMSVTVS